MRPERLTSSFRISLPLAVVVLIAAGCSGAAGGTHTASATASEQHLSGASPSSATTATATTPAWPGAADLHGIPVGAWSRLPAAPHARTEVSAARIGDVAYVVGGFDASGHSSAQVERYNLRTGRWFASTPLPRPLNHMSAAAYGGALYVVGGYAQPGDTSAGAVRSFWRYAPETGRWSALPAAPLARAAAGAVVLGSRLYVVGGRSDTQSTIDTLAIFDFTSGRWSRGPSLHHGREHLAVAAASGAIYAFGGRAVGQGDFADVERYVPGQPAWHKLPSMPVPRAGFQAVGVGRHIILVGGEGAGGTIARIDQLDTATGRWRRLADLPTARHGLGVIADGPLLWAIEGGAQPGLVTSTVVERLRLASSS